MWWMKCVMTLKGKRLHAPLHTWTVKSDHFQTKRKTCWIFFFSQVVHIQKLSSRPRFPCWASVNVSSAILTSSPVACCVPAPPMTTTAWTVAVETAVVRWCARGRVEVGLYMGSHHGVTRVDCKTHLVSTPKYLPSCPGLRRSLASRAQKNQPITDSLAVRAEKWSTLLEQEVLELNMF